VKPEQASKHEDVDADRMCAPGRPERIGKNQVRERTITKPISTDSIHRGSGHGMQGR
jgi:hypothetical protein